MVMIVATLLHIKIAIPIIKWNIWVINQSFASDTTQSWGYWFTMLKNPRGAHQTPNAPPFERNPAKQMLYAKLCPRSKGRSSKLTEICSQWLLAHTVRQPRWCNHRVQEQENLVQGNDKKYDCTKHLLVTSTGSLTYTKSTISSIAT